MAASGRFQIRHCAMPGTGLSGAIFSTLSSDCEAYFIKTSVKRKKLLDLLELLRVGNKSLSEKMNQSQRSQGLNQAETIQEMMEEDLRLQDLIFRCLGKVLSG